MFRKGGTLAMGGIVAAFLAFCGVAFGQGAILQGGPVTASHPVVWYYSGLVGDPGNAAGFGPNGVAGVGISELLLVHQGTGTPPYANVGTGPMYATNCGYDGPVSSGSGYHYLCLDPNANGGGLIEYGYSPPATPLPLNLCVNGSCTVLPQSGGSGSTPATRQITTGNVDTATTTDNQIQWASASPGFKIENLYGCGPTTKGLWLNVSDEEGTAALYPIMLVAGAGNTVAGTSTAMIATTLAGTRISCDGISNWTASPVNPNTMTEWINPVSQYGAIGDEDDSYHCSWTSQLTCPGKNIAYFTGTKIVDIGYAGPGYGAYVGTATWNSQHVLNLSPTPTTAGPLIHVTAIGLTTATGIGYLVGDEVGMDCGSGCTQFNQSTGYVSEIGFYNDNASGHLPTVAAAGTGGVDNASCTVIANGNGTSADGYALQGNYIQVNVVLNSSGNLGSGATISSYANASTLYTANMASPADEPVSAGTCTGLTGAALNFEPSGIPVTFAFNIKANDITTGFYSAIGCASTATALDTLSGAGSGATAECNAATSDARWCTDNTTAFANVIAAANNQSALNRPFRVHTPAGGYCLKPTLTPINGYGNFEGEGHNHTVFFLIANTAGDWPATLDSNQNGSLQNQGGTMTYGDEVNPNRGGEHFGGYTVIGDWSSAATQNALMNYGPTDWMHVYDYEAYYVHGRCWGVGADGPYPTGKGSVRESDAQDVRFEDCGAPGIPPLDIVSLGQIYGPNNLHFRNVRVFDPHGPGQAYRSCGNSDPAHIITWDDSHIELSSMSGTSLVADGLQLGDANCPNESFPAVGGGSYTPSSSPSPGIASFIGAGDTFSNIPAGYGATAGTTAAVHVYNGANNSNIILSGTIGAAGGAAGGGVYFDGGNKSTFRFQSNGASDYQWRAGTSLSSTNVGPGVTYDCGYLGCPLSQLVETDAQPGGANPLSFPMYSNALNHPLGLMWSQTVGVANATSGGQTMFGTGIGSRGFGPNYPVVGTLFETKAFGTYSTAASPGTTTFAVSLGGTTLLNWPTLALGNSQTTVPWSLYATCTFTAVGIAATANCWGTVSASGAATVPFFEAASVTGLNTTTIIGATLNLKTTWNAYASGDTIIWNNGGIWVPN
jgi:hypothetical protein